MTHHAHAPLSLPFDQVDPLFRDLAREHGLTCHGTPPDPTRVEIGEGEVALAPTPQGCRITARADTPDWLFTLQEAAVEHLAEVIPGLTLDWTSPARTGEMPPNFSLAHVVGVTRLTPHFLRLRLTGERLDRLDRDMIHFRLVLPQDDGAPRWPHLDAGGQTVWPEGLHRPAYTVAAIDPQASWLDTDIFIHDGGRICNFAAQAAAGATVGLNGPGGGGIPQAAHLVLAGDETAYPALARIAAAQAAGARIDLTLLGDSADYPFAPRPGLTITHRPRSEAALARALTAAPPADFYWIATEKARLQVLRRAITQDLAIPRTRAHLAAYWSAPCCEE
ncbi:siderophore-interacting protein [Paracoccus sp. p4-l81]|uniref:siderophore-interacting protein n=1 Tax=Paracoccus sp. p4-l81 TaxID=3342806 RepID=UPI0035B9A9B3